jgi:hypothetical protein
MGGIRLFDIHLSDPSRATMALAGGRSFDASLTSYWLTADSARWEMTIDEASRLSSAARRLEWRLRHASEKNAQPKIGGAFRRKLSAGGGEDDEPVIVEIGTTALGDDDAAVYFEFAGQRLTLDAADSLVLLRALQRFGADISEVSQSQFRAPTSVADYVTSRH